MKRLLLIVTAVALAVSLCSCSVIRKAVNAARIAASNNVAETAAPVESIEGSDAGRLGSWPESIPQNIPRFNYGKCNTDQTYKFESDNNVSFSMSYATVRKQDAIEYGKALKELGLEINTSESNKTYSVSGSKQGANGMFEYTVSLYWDDDSGTCSLTIMIYKPEP